MKINKSISLKVSLGNYQMCDFFVSAEAECNESEMYQAGQSLHEYCKKELTKDVNATKKYLQDLANGKVEAIFVCCRNGKHSDCKMEKFCDCECHKLDENPPAPATPSKPTADESMQIKMANDFVDRHVRGEGKYIPSDPANDLLGDYPDSMNPPRKDVKTK